MSLLSQLQSLKDSPKIVLNDKFIGDSGAAELAQFLSNHRRVEHLEIRSNDITGEGFIQIFNALRKSASSLRQIVLDFNKLGAVDYVNWQQSLEAVLCQCKRLERISLSNNEISNDGFIRLACYLATECKNLKLLELRYNKIENSGVQKFIQELTAAKNGTLLFVQLAGNKVKRDVIDQLQSILKANRQKNPISKDKLLMSSALGQQNTGMMNRSNSSNFRGPGIEDITMTNLSKENIVRHLEDILDQNRKDTAEMKVRLEQELQDLQRRERNDARQLHQLDNKCNQILIQNRNLKFEVDRTVSQHQQIERDQQYHLRLHEEKLRQANKELMDLESKYEQIEQRMTKEHQLKLKQIAREWEGRLRNLEQKIRMAENDNNVLDAEIRKNLEKKERLRVEYLDEEVLVRTRVEEEQQQRYSFKVAALEIKLREIQQSREQFIRRNHDLLHQLEKNETANGQNIVDLEVQLCQLKGKEDEFVRKNKDCISRNQKLKSEIGLKQITLEQLEEQINRLNGEIQVKKGYNREQIDKIIHDAEYQRSKREQQKQSQINKLNNLEAQLRTVQLENAKMRQEYAILAQKLQVALGRSVQEVFAQNSLY